MNIGILGAGGIAHKMAATVRGMEDRGEKVTLYAVASRSWEKAEAFAQEEQPTWAFGSYEDMLADPAVDLVYIATPHSHHAAHIRLCVDAGKHVLCEKSFTRNRAEAADALAYAEQQGVYVTEAIWTRYMPSRRIINDLIAKGTIGQPILLTANLAYAIEHKERIARPELAGGALLDVGVYTLNFASMVFGNDLARIESSVQMMGTGVDRTENITLTYADGRQACLMASAAFNSDRRGIVYGDQGFLVVDNINNPQRIDLYSRDNRDTPVRTVLVPGQITGYEYEVRACLRDLAAGNREAREMPHAETLEIMNQMDTLRAQWGMKYPGEVEIP